MFGSGCLGKGGSSALRDAQSATLLLLYNAFVHDDR